MSSFYNTVVSSLGDVVNPLPTGTVLVFQILNPILTNNSHCSVANQAVTAVLLAACAFSCAFSCFTDSYVGTDGRVYYGLVTVTGLLPFSTGPNPAGPNLSTYHLRFSDFVYAAFSVSVFAAVSLMDPNSRGCFFHNWDAKMAARALPSVIGAVASFIAVVFPSARHGVGFPLSAPAPAGQAANAPPNQALLPANA